MDTLIKDEDGNTVSRGRNLRVVHDHAKRRGGVVDIRIERKREHRGSAVFTGEAYVTVLFRDGYSAETDWADYDHAVEWANAKSTRRGSWWTGCLVTLL